ncbi:2-oxo-4-hydroxy-4-carboxy-5-ureidoimidazoline decarboxylase [Mangrovibacter yixingensis]|uniref:2-oxo-4-hydroxy-4-carboxy-5-ureidoimidazoline decarboxylase n=1 Tax=Mangrovibacter yixingensis TaxID=1529639 RepID=UPI001CFB6680|nr:2-oxo-4-hydroxy-4-carboxy-5-ureidoimidazoline decarboxylase [Mangrovibacter yixingensis]
MCAVAEAPTPLARFNQADTQAAKAMIQACVAIPAWQEALVAGRPYSSFTALKKHAIELAETWQAAELNQALSAHPRIGERPTGKSEEAQLSRGEQAAVNTADQALVQALAKGNADYEKRFGRVFLIRAKGLSGQDILQALQRRMVLKPEQESLEALEQLRQITLLRLEGVFLP